MLGSFLAPLASAQYADTSADNAPQSLPSSSNDKPQLISPPPATGTKASGVEKIEDGQNRLRSAYDRSSNPAYYNMLDQLEKNQKRRKRHAQPQSTPTVEENALPAASPAEPSSVKRHHAYRTHKKQRRHPSTRYSRKKTHRHSLVRKHTKNHHHAKKVQKSTHHRQRHSHKHR
jgi:hypothetical protein